MHDDFDQSPQYNPAPLGSLKGRGAARNCVGRFDKQRIEAVELTNLDIAQAQSRDDGGDQSKITTHLHHETAKSIITRNPSPDLPFSASLNPYRGCEHGCIYCYARPSHNYLDLSPGLDFETELFAKDNAIKLLEAAFAKRGYTVTPIALGVNTDAYQPIEKTQLLTRQLLETFVKYRHPVGLITKSSLIERDIDLLQTLAQQNLVHTAITLTTLDHDIARTLEPRAASPSRRLKTIERLAKAGVPVSVSIAPIIPFITEQDLERVMEAAANAGATGMSHVILRLPHEVAPLFKEWLATHFPERAERVMNRIRDMRGGEDYVSDFATRRTGTGVWAKMIATRIQVAARRLNLQSSHDWQSLDCSQFLRPLPTPRTQHRPPEPLVSRQFLPPQLDLF